LSSMTISVAYPFAEELSPTLSFPEDQKANLSIERFFSCDYVSDDSNEQKSVEDREDDDEIKKTYRMHLATIPGDAANKFKLQEAQTIHRHLINFIKQFLKCLNTTYQVLDESSFSCTNEWGIEPYGCFLVTCTRTMICGLCALFGMVFRQDAVGVFTCFTDDKDQTHNVFLVSRSDCSPITDDEALKIVKSVGACFPMLSAQRDQTGASMEFHDYCNEERSVTCVKFLELLHNFSSSHLLYQVKKDNAKSFLMNKEDYHQAIEKAGLESYELLFQMSAVHFKAYPEC